MRNNPARIYDRDLKKILEQYLKTPEILAIKGPRQVGKTTLMQDLYQDLVDKNKCKFLSFEKRSDLEIFEKDIEAFKTLYVEKKEFVFIDEFQYARNGGQKLKYLFDTTKTKFIISGSSSLELTQQTGKYLVGRLFSFYLYPFSFAEYLSVHGPDLLKLIDVDRKKFASFLNGESKTIPVMKNFESEALKKQIGDLLQDYVIFGGYPRVITAKTRAEKLKVLSSILQTYLLKDIKTLLELASDEELLTLSKALALQIGNLIEYKELGDIASLSYLSLKKHLNILKQTFIADFIKPYYKNKRTEMIKNPKVYSMDLGIRNSLIDNFNPLLERTDKGELLENFVYTSLLKTEKQIKFWRTKSQAEVDFVLEKDGKPIPIEVKFKRDVIGKSLYSFIEKYKPKIAIVVTWDQSKRVKIGQTEVYFTPAYYL